MSVKIEERHRAALDLAATKITQWEYASQIQDIYLYGSYARGDHGYNSDVDIYIICTPGIPKRALRELKCMVLPEDAELPDVEVRFGFRPLEEETDFFHENVRKDGVLLWQKRS